MKKYFLIMLFFPLIAQGQLMGYHSNGNTIVQTIDCLTDLCDTTDWPIPAMWADSIGSIDLVGTGVPSNTIRILFDTRSETSSIAFKVTCTGGYMVDWHSRSESTSQHENVASASTAYHTYDTTKCQKYVWIEITPQGANPITAFLAMPHTIASQNQLPSVLWFASDFVGSIVTYTTSTVTWSKLVAIHLESITALSNYAFAYCVSLVGVQIPSSGLTFGTNCFQGCVSLQHFHLPTDLQAIPDYLFANCENLCSMRLPGSITTIGVGAFSYCYSFQTINLPVSVQAIGSNAFAYCYTLSSIVLPDNTSFTSINTGLLTNCFSLQAVSIPNRVTSIGNSAFNQCFSLQSLTLPSSLLSLGDYTFKECTGITSLTLPSGMTTLSGSPFYGMSNLKELIIPSGVTATGTYAFTNMKNLQKIQFLGNLTTLGNYIFNSDYCLKTVTIPSTVTAISTNAFNACYSLKKVIYNGTMTNPSDLSGMFLNCEQLDTLKAPGIKATSFTFAGTSGKKNHLGADGNLAGDSIPVRINWASSTFTGSTSPQLDLRYNSLDTTQMQKIFKCLPTVTGKTVSVVGCTGAATLSSYAKAFAIAKGWTVLN